MIYLLGEIIRRKKLSHEKYHDILFLSERKVKQKGVGCCSRSPVIETFSGKNNIVAY